MEGADLTQALMDGGADISGFFQAMTRKFPTQIGNMMGKTAKSVKDLGKITRQVILEKTPDDLKRLAGNMAHSTKEGYKDYAKTLSRAADLPTRRRQAVIFSLMQQKEFREAVNLDEGTPNE